MFGSLPHFLNADPSLLDNIDGLSPNREEHAIFMHFETVIFLVRNNALIFLIEFIVTRIWAL